MHSCEVNSRFVQAHAQRGILSSPSLWWLASEIRVHKKLKKKKQPASAMGSMLGDLPSFDPHNFSQLRPSDPSNPSKMTPATYRPTHSRTLPPPDQVITTDAKNILVRNIYQHAKEKLRPKRAASEHLTPEHGSKQLKPSIPY